MQQAKRLEDKTHLFPTDCSSVFLSQLVHGNAIDKDTSLIW
jgi:hypothetical protein